ncbi:MAG: cation:proton antiporter [Gammaproteobacteria bacterium]|nr:cation:proton antiporter [Gammaproteobacteria bacterium]
MIFSLFLIFFGAACLATAALYARQAMILAYIAVGALIGPWGLDLVSNPELIADISNIGILFLLFLLGLNLELAELSKLFREAVIITTVSSVLFAACGFGVAVLFGFSYADACITGIAMMFSSTIIALKLLPTSALHHQRMGEMIVSILLLQDIVAILALIGLHSIGSQQGLVFETIVLILGLPLLVLAAWWVARHVLTYLFSQFDQIQEYLFLVSIGWCLGLAELATIIGLSHEIGAFIAGVTLATSPIARFLAESLKPLRDFFLVLFFFALGAGVNIGAVPAIILPAVILALIAVAIKPWVYRYLLQREQEKSHLARETGMRLGQISEFSLLIALVAAQLEVLSEKAGLMIQTATILSFVASSYWVVRFYPTPIAADPALRRD